MKINGFTFFLLLFLLIIVLSSVYAPLRYLRYLLPLFPILAYSGRTTLSVDKKVSEYYYPFIVFYILVIGYLFLQNVLFSDLSKRFFPNSVFILSPLFFIFLIIPFFRSDHIRHYILTIFFINIGVFFYDEAADLIKVLTDLQALKAAVFDSGVPTENHLAFVFGFFVLYFIIEKYPRRYQLVSFLFFLLCFKRIAIAAVVMCVAVYFLLSVMRVDVSRHRKPWAILGVLVNLIFIRITTFIVSGNFDEFVFAKTGLSTDQFLMGRKTFYSAAFQEVGSINWFGTGLGKIDDTIFSAYGEMMNLHSEILKNYFEFGVILFVCWLLLLFYKTLFSPKSAIFLLYLNILMLTDNVFIYFDIMFYFYFFILIFLIRQKETTEGNFTESKLEAR